MQTNSHPRHTIKSAQSHRGNNKLSVHFGDAFIVIVVRPGRDEPHAYCRTISQRNRAPITFGRHFIAAAKMRSIERVCSQSQKVRLHKMPLMPMMINKVESLILASACRDQPFVSVCDVATQHCAKVCAQLKLLTITFATKIGIKRTENEQRRK